MSGQQQQQQQQQQQLRNNRMGNENSRPNSPPVNQINTTNRIIAKPGATNAPGRQHRDGDFNSVDSKRRLNY